MHLGYCLGAEGGNYHGYGGYPYILAAEELTYEVKEGIAADAGENTGNNAGHPNDDYGISKVIRNILEGDVLAAPESGSLSLRNFLGGTGLYLSYVRM